MRLTPRQLLAVHALAEGRSVNATATAAGVNVSTVFRWRQYAAFVAALKAAKDEAFSEGLDAVRRATATAAKVCVTLMAPSNKPEIRLMAARAVWGVALKANEQLNVEERLQSLERRLPK